MDETVEGFRSLTTAVVADVFRHAGYPQQVMSPAIQSLQDGWRLCGRAFTHANLPRRKNEPGVFDEAEQAMQPGDIIVESYLGAWGINYAVGAHARGCVSNLAGHDSHGVVRIPSLVRDALSGRLKPAASPQVTQENPSTAMVDGGSTFGHVGSRLATEIAVRKARDTSIAGVALTRANHTGRIGEWAEIGADAGMITLVLGSRANSSRGAAGGTLAPFGGRTGAMGTSPIAWSVPRRDAQPPILLDYATSAVAQGKLQIARAKGDNVPLGWIIDSQGRPTTNVEEFFRGGAQLPFGGHKGYALALIVSVLSIGLSAGDQLDVSEHASCLFVVCVDPAAFRPAEEFLDYVEETAARIKAVPPAEGFDEVLLPGEPEARSRIARSRDGIPVPDEIWAQLMEVAASLGVPTDSSDRTTHATMQPPFGS